MPAQSTLWSEVSQGPWQQSTARVNGIRLHYVTGGNVAGGNNPPLYLLHGFPQSSYIWRKMAPMLAKHFSLVIPDLRGYGDSDKPSSGYDKRNMAQDIRALADHLGHRKIGMVGHDRGGRVAHRYALDHQAHLTALCVLDIEPTLYWYQHLSTESIQGAWHWLFLPNVDFAERLISTNAEFVMRHFLRSWVGELAAIEETAVQEYLRCFNLPGAVRAMCTDYWNGGNTDLAHDEVDLNRQLSVPLLVLWGALNRRHQLWDMQAVWQTRAEKVQGYALENCGHFIPEEKPKETAQAVIKFFSKNF